MRREPIRGRSIEMTPSQPAFDIPSWVYGDPPEAPASQERNDAYPLKRLFDIAVVLVGLLVSAPLWVVIAVAIKLEDWGPIFFIQERWGKNKTRMRVYKFRTMVPNAVEKFGHIQARENDPRVTRVGR